MRNYVIHTLLDVGLGLGDLLSRLSGMCGSGGGEGEATTGKKVFSFLMELMSTSVMVPIMLLELCAMVVIVSVAEACCGLQVAGVALVLSGGE